MPPFVNPNADNYSTKGFGFFRLNAELSCPGDIYETPQGQHAMVLGPECDIERVRVGYYDDQVDTFLNQVIISPARGIIGAVYARTELYVPANRPGKILIWPDDLFNPDPPPSVDVENDSWTLITPRLEVLQYFSPVASLTSGRNDKRYLFQNLPAPPGNGNVYVQIPYYGRKYASIIVTSTGTAKPIVVTVIGLDFEINENILIERAFLTSAANIQHNLQVRAATHGMWDMLLVKWEPSDPFDPPTDPVVIEIHTSDIPA